MRVDRVLLVLVLFSIVSLGVSVALLTVSVRIPSHGTLRCLGLGFFGDAAGSLPVSELDWGLVEPGGVVVVTVYARNNGTVSGVMGLTVSEWVPVLAGEYMNVTWNREGYVLPVDVIVPVTFTLRVSGLIHDVTSFRCSLLCNVEG